LSETRSFFQNFDFHPQGISRQNRTAPLHFIHTHEISYFPAVLRFTEHDHASDLGHGLHDQDPRHDGMPGKMPLKKIIVHGDLFESSRPYARLKILDAIHKKKRIAVRNDLLDIFHGQCFLDRFVGRFFRHH